MIIKLIAAIGLNNAIGTADNTIPWRFHSEDMKIFSKKTKSEGGVVLMGRKTYESLPEKYKPLKDRENVVITKDGDWGVEGVGVYSSPEEAMSAFQGTETIWIIGGGSMYSYFFEMADELHISHFDISPQNATVFFPDISKDIWQAKESSEYPATQNSPSFTHTVYIRKI